MNVLAPVADRRQAPPGDRGRGRARASRRASSASPTPRRRKRAMHDRVGGATCPLLTLEEVVTRESTSLKQSIARRGWSSSTATRSTRPARRASAPPCSTWCCRSSARPGSSSATRACAASCSPPTTGSSCSTTAPQPPRLTAARIDPKRRHVFSPVAADHAGEVQGRRSRTSGTTSTGPADVPGERRRSSTPAGGRWASCTAGTACRSGSSRCSPLVHRTAVGGSSTRYGVIRATAREGVAGMHCVEARVDGARRSRRWTSAACRRSSSPLRVPELPRTCRSSSARRAAGRRIAAGTIVADRRRALRALLPALRARPTRGCSIEIYHPECRGGRGAVRAGRPLRGDRAAGTQRRRPPAPTTSSEPSRELAASSSPRVGSGRLFEHLAAHGAVTESEAAAMLGGPRGCAASPSSSRTMRQKAPFAVRIDVSAG